MKTAWTLHTIVASAALAIGSLTLTAQTPDQTVKATAPFGFEVGSQHFAPGVYTLRTPIENVVMLRSRSKTTIIMTQWGESTRPSKTAKIIFRRYGDHYFLRQIWFSAVDDSYLETPESKAEKQAKTSEFASNQTRPSDVEVAMLRIP
ncbi:MAG TPA: hypothetical protein VHY48_07795 [Acidobacteriaceae bacterium]|jgi:hypothetical protein|nr:hypothetical protein [Acidobacteriaceae bacterium]